MTRAARASFALGALLAAFGALLGCGQRGPLTLPESARPIERLDQGNAPPPAGTQGSAAAPADPVPRPEDDERKSE
jgi:predicted small lipoprotein YifL